MELLHPNLLWLAIGLLLLIFVPSKPTTGDMNARQRMLRTWPMLVGFTGAIAVFAMARPHLVSINYYESVRPVEIVGVIDNSGSQGLLITRNENSKIDQARHDELVEASAANRQGFIDFAKDRPQDNIGIVVFDDDATVLVPLAPDNGANIKTEINKLPEPSKGTDAAKGFNMALDMLEQTSATHQRILVMGTDADWSMPELETSMIKKRIKDLNVEVFMVAVHDVYEPRTTWIVNARDFVVAAGSEGNFLFTASAEGIAKAFRMVSRLVPPVQELRVYKSTQDVTWMPLSLACAIGLMLLGVFAFGGGKPKTTRN